MLKFAQNVIRIFSSSSPFSFISLSILVLLFCLFSHTDFTDNKLGNNYRVGCPQCLAKNLLSKSVVGKPWPMGKFVQTTACFYK